MGIMQEIQSWNPKEVASRSEVKALWDKSFMWTLGHRRSSRNPIGVDVPKDAFFNYDKKKNPVGLSAVELALLCWAAVGSNGLLRGDGKLDCHTKDITWEGTTNLGAVYRWNYLLFNNDDGLFSYKRHVPTRPFEIEKQEDMAIIFQAFKDGLTQLNKESIIKDPMTCPAVGPGNNLFTFRPGTTVFFLISDTTVNYFSMVHHMWCEKDPRSRPYLIDEMTGKPAGLKKWVDNGYFKGPPIPLSMLEATYFPIASKDSISAAQNISLMSSAMGMGSFPHHMANPMIIMGGTPVMRGLGFRFASDKKGVPYAVGIDGVMEAHMPPYMTIDQAIEDHFNLDYGPNGCFSAGKKAGDKFTPTGYSKEARPVYSAYKDHDAWIKAAQTENPDKDLKQAMKDLTNYVYNTYGRFPKLIEPFLLPFLVQVHHIDTDFYDQYWVKEALTNESREHLNIWHTK